MDIIEKKNIPFSPPDIGEEEINGVINTLKSGWITTGPKTKEFERRIADYCNTSRAVCLNSATACMELTLRLLGVGPGDEVITSAYTYTATCSVICHVGATPILVDVAKDSFEMDYNQLNAKITERTKVIIPIDLAGIMCDYKKIFEIVEAKKDLFKASNEIQKAFGRIIVMADAAHAFGASKDNKMCGEVADFTSFSFHAVKNLTTAEGGAVVWKDIENIDNENIYEQYQLLSLHGQSKDALAKTKLGAWEYDVISPAYKCNMTDVIAGDIMAGIGLAQLDKYQKLLSRRKEIIYKYNEGLKDLDVQILNHYDENHNSSGHLYLVRINGISGEQRNEIITEMAKKGIACNVHYKPLPLLTAYKKLGFDIKDYPNAYNQFINEVTLPLHTKLSDDDINYILKKLCELL